MSSTKSKLWSSVVSSAALFAGTVSGLATGSALAFLIWQLA
jgi:hypothetical protein